LIDDTPKGRGSFRGGRDRGGKYILWNKVQLSRFYALWC
jgi:hypothetical protein